MSPASASVIQDAPGTPALTPPRPPQMHSTQKRFRHFLITKFNVYFADWKKFRNSSSFGSAQWMKHRFQLFDRFCFPSIQNQTNQDFKWLILLDRETGSEDRRTMLGYQQRFANIQLVFTTEENLRRDVQEAMDQGEERDYAITTRIDNDDAYRNDVIEVVQRHFAAQECEFMNFSRGYQYCMKNGRLYPHEDMSSPFMSLVEKRRTEGFRTVQFEAHDLVRGKWPLRQIEDGRYWVQVIHDRNAANHLRAAGPGWWRYYLPSAGGSPRRILDLLGSVFRRRDTLGKFNVKL
jgi:hypothetical protein